MQKKIGRVAVERSGRLFVTAEFPYSSYMVHGSQSPDEFDFEDTMQAFKRAYFVHRGEGLKSDMVVILDTDQRAFDVMNAAGHGHVLTEFPYDELPEHGVTI